MTVDARARTQQFRASQVLLGAAVMRQVASVWAREADTDVVGSMARIIPLVVPILGQAYGQSVSQGMDYFTDFRSLAGARGFATATPADGFNSGKAAKGLYVEGQIKTLQQIQRGVPSDVAVRRAGVRVMGAAQYEVLEGGRETVTRSVSDDRQAKGWQRVTSGDGCYFCEMLSARGGVYSPDTVGFDAHTNCACEPEPVYTRRILSDRQQEMQALYNRAAKGQSDPLNAFRRAYEEQRQSA